MLKKTLRASYRHKLARPLTLADGTTLVTLRDAANVLLDAANARSGGLVDTIWSLRTAAETGKRSDIAEATDLIERALRDRLVGSGK
jgi:hypothetical protein